MQARRDTRHFGGNWGPHAASNSGDTHYLSELKGDAPNPQDTHRLAGDSMRVLTGPRPEEDTRPFRSGIGGAALSTEHTGHAPTHGNSRDTH